MASAEYNFDRIVKVVLVSKERVENKYVTKDSVEISFDPTTDRDLCPRIDFWVQGKGTEFTGTSDYFKTARIDLYNIGPDLNKVLSVYETTLVGGAWNVSNVLVDIKLSVGYKNKGLTTIFDGHVGSYNIERVQTESNVDNIWHLFCQSTVSEPITIIGEDEKALTEDDFLEPGYSRGKNLGINNFDMTGDQAIRLAFMSYPRMVKSWVDGIYDGYYEDERKLITEKDFDKYCEILYLKDGFSRTNKVIDYDLQHNFKENVNYIWQTVPEDLNDAISMITKRLGNYSFRINPPTDDNLKYQIIVYKKTLKATAESTKGADWVINNFENLVKAPTISGGTMTFTMIMEPAMRTFDTIELRVDDKFTSPLSFEFNFNQASAGAMTNFAGSNVIGLAQASNKTMDIDDVVSRGNIFYRKYCVLFLEQQGSTHTNTWTTTACCSCNLE